MTNTIRAFFAIQIPTVVQQELVAVQTALRSTLNSEMIHWSRPTHFHVTLQFIGQLVESDIPQLSDLIQHNLSDTKAFSLNYEALELFPSHHDPRIISIHVSPPAILKQLSDAIGKAMQDLHYRTESRGFRGHLTLARLNHYPITEEIFNQISVSLPKPTLIQNVVLFESKPGSRGSNYVPLAEFVLPPL